MESWTETAFQTSLSVETEQIESSPFWRQVSSSVELQSLMAVLLKEEASMFETLIS
jgi:hypothetical protein